MPNNLHALGGLWRLSLRRFYNPTRWLIMAGLLVLLVVLSFTSTRSDAEAAREFLPWVSLFYICFLVPIFTFLSAAGTIRDDLQAGSVDYLFTRPVRRPVFVFLRYLAHVGCTQIDFLIALAVLIGVGFYRNVPGMPAAIPVLLLGQVLVIIAFSAFGFLCAMLTSRYVIIGLVYGAVIEVGLGNVPTQLNRLSMIRQAVTVLTPTLNGQRVGMGGPLAVEPLSSPAAIVLLLGISIVLLGVTAVIFATRELAGTGTRDA